jgi:hypothetical protein
MERTTGTRDEHYDLISVLYHGLQGAENCDRYAADAEASGDERLAAFFREAQVMQIEMAERAKGLLGIGAAINPRPEGGEPPVAEVPADVAAEVPPEPVTVRVPPDDLDTTIRALEGGPEELPVEEALDEIDGWRLWLEGAGDPDLMPVAEELGQLGNLLRSGNAHPAEVGRVLGSLGERVRDLASKDVAAPVADELRILGGLLNTAGRDLPG